MSRFERIDDFRWELPRRGAMRVPGRLYCSEAMLAKLERDRVADQVANVAALPGIVSYSLAMPDAHWGYGMPVGGVAAMDAADGVISPGGVGYDISCGVRLLRCALPAAEVLPRLPELMDALFAAVPSGVGSEGPINLSRTDLNRVFSRGARWAVEAGYGEPDDLERIEDGGTLEDADPEAPSERARERGRRQLATLGSGNHFLEVQRIEAVYDRTAAAAFGLFEGGLAVLIHTGSRGCGYQICADHLDAMQKASSRYRIPLADRQLCCAPFSSPEGREYFAAMNAGGNFARANRQAITHFTRLAFMRALGLSPAELGLAVVYDTAHNICKLEEHEVEGRKRKLLVHRKGATRAFPAGRPELPEAYRAVGQPVLIPGSMGTASYVMVGTDRAMAETFGTTAHGAGRAMSRTQAAKQIGGRELFEQLKRQGVEVRTDSFRGLAEEAPFAYKDVSEVVEACDGAGISKKVARLRPLGVVKG